MNQALQDNCKTRPATQSNASIVCELWNARSRHVHNTTPYSESSVLKQWDDPRFDLETDSLLMFDSQSALIGYAHIRDVKNPPVDVFCTIVVHLDHDDQDWLWQARLDWSKDEARRVIPRAPADALIALISAGSSDDASKLRQLEEHGFKHSRTFHRMTMDFGDAIEPVALPDWITLRAFVRGEDNETLVDAYRDAFRDHYGHLDQPFETDLATWQRWMDDDDFDPNLWFLATDTAHGTIAGYCCCYAEDHGDDTVGLVDELGVRRDWRRRGITRALLTHALSALQSKGLHGDNLRVDSDNKKGALRLYKSVGMDIVSSTLTYVKELRPRVNLVTQ